MRCPVCAALLREHSLMNQIEATTVLRQRTKMILRPHPAKSDPHSDRDLEEVVLFSRKCQAKIAFRLRRHQEEVHAA